MTNTVYKHREIRLQIQRNTVYKHREIHFAKDENAGVELIDEPEDGLPVLEPGLPICPGPFPTSIQHTPHHLSEMKSASSKESEYWGSLFSSLRKTSSKSTTYIAIVFDTQKCIYS